MVKCFREHITQEKKNGAQEKGLVSSSVVATRLNGTLNFSGVGKSKFAVDCVTEKELKC